MTDTSRQSPVSANNNTKRSTGSRSAFRRLSATGAPLRELFRLGLFGAVLLALSIVSVAIDWDSGDVKLEAGQIADHTIKADEALTYTSELRTEERRQEAYDDERNIVTQHDQNVRSTQVDQLRLFLDHADQLRSDRSKSREDLAADLQTELEGLSPDEATRILGLSSASWERVRSDSVRVLNDTLADPIRQDEVKRVKDDLHDNVSTQLSSDEQALVIGIVRPFIKANVFIDDQQTLANREAAAAAVDPVTITVLAGQAIVRDGDIVTKYDVEKLEKLGLLSHSLSTATRLARSGLVTILTLAMVMYLFRFHRPVWQGRKLLLLSLVVLGPILMARLVLPHEDIQYMFPVAASAMLLAVLLDFQIAVVVAGLLSLFIGVIAGMSMELTFLYFLASAAGAFFAWNAERTITFVWAGMAVSAASFATAICFTALQSDITTSIVLQLLVETLVAGALAASLTFLSFSLLGSVLGITTHLQLLELAHPNQPLLYRLAREAPGTYHHSIVVSNLAESAVEAVGGDPLFARVAVLYHDIGKIIRPTFFIENQANLENPHDLLDPKISARVIIDHVSDGVRLARKARLPQRIVDIIEQHHGTTLIRYFYCKTLDAGEDVTEDEFRYAGPKPQTKEAGVIMMADSVEAAVRASALAGRLASAKDPKREGADTLETIVQRVTQERIDDGQLSECDLTLREIELVRRTFIQLLEGIYHPRVEYPSMPVTAERQAQAPATSAAG